MVKSKRNSVFKLDMLVLAILKRGSYYGYEIATLINKETDDLFSVKEGVLYPILYRLEQTGLISSSEQIVNRKLRIYYHITELGITELKILKNDFIKKVKAIEMVLEGDSNEE